MLFVALEKLLLLEDLDLSPSHFGTATDVFLESVCKACPLLRTLTMKFSNVKFLGASFVGGEIPVMSDFVMVIDQGKIPTMLHVRSLKLFDCDLTDNGLIAILDNVPE